MVGSRDMTGRIFSLFPVKNFVPVTLSGHRNTVIGCYFEDKSLNVSFLPTPLQNLCLEKYTVIYSKKCIR